MPMLLSEFFEKTYRIRRLRGKSPNTVRLYRISVRSFAKTLGRDPTLDDLTDDNVSIHMQRLLDAGRAAPTVNKEREQLLVLWRYAHRSGLVSKWPDVLPEKEPIRVPQAWLPKDIEKLLNAIDKLDGTIGNIPKCIWWRALIEVILDTGERIGAVRAAEWSWLEDNWLRVPAENRKGGKRERQYLLSEPACKALTDLRKASTSKQAIWPWPYCNVYLWNRYKRILAGAGMSCGRRDKFHRIRRTTASAVHAAGLDATEALDHASRQTTKLYLDPRFVRDTQPSAIMVAFRKQQTGQFGNPGHFIK